MTKVSNTTADTLAHYQRLVNEARQAQLMAECDAEINQVNYTGACGCGYRHDGDGEPFYLLEPCGTHRSMGPPCQDLDCTLPAHHRTKHFGRSAGTSTRDGGTWGYYS
jgi:hypothetical protein